MKRHLFAVTKGLVKTKIVLPPCDRRKAHIVLLVLYWPTLFVLAHIPIPKMVYAARVSDKALHFAAYLILTFLLWFAVSPNEKVKWLKKRTWLALGLIAVYGILDEVIQGFVGRSCDARDFLADLVGGAAALIICSILSYWPAMLVVTGVSIFALTNLAKANIYSLMPAGAIIFNILSYGLFTCVWIRNMRWLGFGGSKKVWPFMALTVPLALLAVVEITAMSLNRFWGISAMGAAAGTIVLVVCGVYVKSFGIRRKSAG